MLPGDVEASIRNPARLAVLRRLHLLDTPPEDTFDRLTRFASRRLGVPIALVNLIDEERQYFKSAIGMGDLRELPVAVGVCSHAVATGKPLVLDDARANPAFASNPIVTDYGLVAYIGIPLETSAGHCLGTFCVVDTEPRTWSEQNIATVRNLAGAAITEIEIRLESLGQERHSAGESPSSSRGAVPRSVPELTRHIAWGTHATLSIIEDLEVASEWGQDESVGELLQGFVSNAFSLSHLLWPGGKRQSDQILAPQAATVRKSFGLNDTSPLHWSRLAGLSRALSLSAAECAERFDRSRLSIRIDREDHGLEPPIEAIRSLWATIASQVDDKMSTQVPA
jgi:hypothetical protein